MRGYCFLVLLFFSCHGKDDGFVHLEGNAVEFVAKGKALADFLYDSKEILLKRTPIVENSVTKRNRPTNHPKPGDLWYLEGEPCGYVGLERWELKKQNLCSGFPCHPLQANCNGSILEFTPHRNDSVPKYNGNIATDCVITKLRCNTGLGTFFDLKEQFGSTQCKIEKTICGDGVYMPQDISNSRLSGSVCHSQVMCQDNRRYGNDYFGFQCEQEEIICSGKVVDHNSVNNPEVISQLDKCFVQRRGCTLDELKMSCYRYEIACDGRTMRDNCTYNQLKLPCSQSSPQCKPSKLNCNGIAYTADNYVGPIGNCIITELQCPDSPNPIDNNSIGQNCVAEKLRCAGVLVSPSTYSGSLANCVLEGLKCPASPNTACKHLDVVCQGAPSCSLSQNEFQCANDNTCNGLRNTTTCICPIDRLEPFCVDFRPIRCSLNVSYPLCNRDKYLPLSKSELMLDADWPCYYYDLDEKFELGSTLDCKFDIAPNITTDIINANFTYFMKNSKFALLEPANWTVELKFYNFEYLGDPDSIIKNITLDELQMQGLAPVWFNTSTITQIPDKYWTGNRLYMEIGWSLSNNDHPPYPSKNRVIERRFIDTYKQRLPLRPKTESNGMDWTLFWIIIASVLVGIGVIFVAFRRLTEKNYYE